MLSTLILASGSEIRQTMLRNAGLSFSAEIARVDEEPVKLALQAEGASPRDIADALAELKAQKVSNRFPDAFVIGCDQILDFKGESLSKPGDQADAIQQLKQLRNNSHTLWSAAVIYQHGAPIWRHIGQATLTMRDISDAYLEDYVVRTWDGIRNCVGGYQIESEGVRLFSKITGDYFSILGLPLIQILDFLAVRGDRLIVKLDKIPLAGVIGHPIAHSRSPMLHGYWLKYYGIEGYYIPMDIDPANLGETLKMLPKMGFRGVNVTIPHKETVLTFADRLTDRASLIGAANTLTFGPDGAIIADNTDGFGFIENLRQNCPTWDPTAGPAAVLGAGGGAKAVVTSLLQAGVPEVRICNRTRVRAESLKIDLGKKITVYEWARADEMLEDAATVVNTTSLGMGDNPPLPLKYTRLSPTAVVTDIVYTPLETPLLIAAKEKGCRTVDGLGMLIFQGVPGFERWFNRKPEVTDELREVLLA